MASTSTTSVLEDLKYTYGTDRLLYLFNKESVAFNILGRVKKPVGGRGQFILPRITQNPGAFSGIIEGGTIPTALDMDTAEATFSLKEFVGVTSVTWKLLQDARNSKFAFQTAVQTLDDGIRRRIMRNLNADVLDDGRGRLAVMSAADDGAGVFTATFLPRLEKGMVVDIMSNSDDDTKRADSVTVSAVDPVSYQVTLSGAVSGESAGDYAVIQDTCDDSINNSLHTFGLLCVISNADPAAVVGDFGGVDRSTAGNEDWEAPVLSNSGTNRPLTEDLLLQGQDAVRVKGGSQLKAWMSNLAIVRRYHEMLRNDTYAALNSPAPIAGGIGRKGNNGQNEDGKTSYEFSGIPWHVDPYFVNNRIIGLDTDHFFLGVGENETPRPVSEIWDVDTFKRTTSATFDMEWYYQCQLLSDNPAAGVQIQDVAES